MSKKKHGAPVTVGELRAMPVGSKVFCYWAKDDDPNDVRMNYEANVFSNRSENDRGQNLEFTSCQDEYDQWDIDISKFTYRDSDIGVSNSRGMVYFYRLPE